MRVAILGFGLIGGSIARALRAGSAGSDGSAAAWTLVAWSPTGVGPRRARDEGLLDAVADDATGAVVGADLVVLAAPPLACLDLLDGLARAPHGTLAAAAVITDVASTKAAIVARAGALGLRFVGGHPMAGRELSGYAAADAALFQGRPWVVVPPRAADEEATERVEALAAACGALPVRMPAAEHDAAVAAISHLPLVLSAALVESVTSGGDWPAARTLAASGWRDMTRLARGDVEMGAGIAATNAPELARRLRDLRAVVDAWLAELGEAPGPRPERLAERLRAARAALEADER